MKPKFSLKVKSIVLILLIALVLSSTAIFISYRVYATTMDNRYRTTAMGLAKTAASLAFKAGIPEANPVLLEPVVTLVATVPTDNSGDIMGDINY